jgi:hypothetical protein
VVRGALHVLPDSLSLTSPLKGDELRTGRQLLHLQLVAIISSFRYNRREITELD